MEEVITNKNKQDEIKSIKQARSGCEKQKERTRRRQSGEWATSPQYPKLFTLSEHPAFLNYIKPRRKIVLIDHREGKEKAGGERRKESVD